MKPVSVLLALITLGVALSAVAWVTRSTSETKPIDVAEVPGVAKPVDENPFEVIESGPRPKAVVDESMFEFGSMELGQTESHTYIIRNEGDAPLKLKVGPVQCKCTIADLDVDGVAPGESAEINLSWKPIDITEEFHQKAVIFTNDPENRSLELHVKGAVERLAEISPAGDWPLDRIAEGETREFTGLIMSNHLDEFQVLDYETSTELLTAEFVPLSDELKQANQVKSGYQIHCKLKGEMPVGRFEATLTLMTDMSGGREFTIRMVGMRPGPFSIIGQNWRGGEMLLNMGDVQSGPGKTVKLSMFVSREEEPVEFTVTSATPAFLDLKIEKDETFDVPAREKYWLTFTVPANSSVGSWTNENAGKIIVATNRADVPQIEIYVELTVHE